MCAAGEAVNEVIRRPGAGKLHLAFAHHDAGGGELVLVAFDMLAFDEVGDVQHHLSAFGKAATDFFIQGQEETVHLKADRTGARLTLAGAGCVLTQVGEISAAHVFRRELALNLLSATIVDKDFEVHLGFASQLVNVS